MTFVLNARMHLEGPTLADAALIKRQTQAKLSGISTYVDVKVNKNNIRRLTELRKELRLVKTEAKTAGEGIEEFGRRIGIAGKRYLAFSLATVGVVKALGALRSGVDDALDFEKQIIKIAQVSNRATTQVAGLRKEILGISASFGVSSSEIAAAAVTLAQTGRPLAQVRKDLEGIAKANLSPTFGNAKDTVEGLIAVQRQFEKSGLSTVQILSKLNTVAGKFPVESADLITAVKKTGGAFQAAGGDLDELLALFTAVRSTTRESADTIGTAFRTITGRLGRIKTINFFKDIIDVDLIKDGKILAPMQAIGAIVEGISKKNIGPRSTIFSSIVEELGGIRQRAKVIPLLLKFAEAQKVLNVSQRAGNSITKDSEQAQEGLATQITQVRQEFQGFVDNVLKDPIFRKFATELLDITKGLIGVADAARPLIPLVGALGTLFAFKAGSSLLRGISPTVPKIKEFSDGGQTGFSGKIPGVGSTDNRIIAGMSGEYIIKKPSVIKYGTKFLDAVNDGQIPKMAHGGGVGGKRSRRLGGAAADLKQLRLTTNDPNAISKIDAVLEQINDRVFERPPTSKARESAGAPDRVAAQRRLAERNKANSELNRDSGGRRQRPPEKLAITFDPKKLEQARKAVSSSSANPFFISSTPLLPNGEFATIDPRNNANESIINPGETRKRRHNELLPINQAPSKTKRQALKKRRGISTPNDNSLNVIPNNGGRPPINLSPIPQPTGRSLPVFPDNSGNSRIAIPDQRHVAGLNPRKENRSGALPIGTFKGIEKEVNRLGKTLGISVKGVTSGVKDLTATQRQKVKGRSGIVPNASFDPRDQSLAFSEKNATSGSVREELIHAQDFKLGGKGKKFASEIVGTTQNTVANQFLPIVKREAEATATKRGLRGDKRKEFIGRRTSLPEVFSSAVRRQPDDVQRGLLASTTNVVRGPNATNANLRGVTGSSKRTTRGNGGVIPFVPTGPPRPPGGGPPFGPFPQPPGKPFGPPKPQDVLFSALNPVPTKLFSDLPKESDTFLKRKTKKNRLRDKNPFKGGTGLGQGGGIAAAGVLGAGVLSSGLLDNEQAEKATKILGAVAIQFGILNQALQHSKPLVAARAKQEVAQNRLNVATVNAGSVKARQQEAHKNVSGFNNQVGEGRENLRQGAVNKQRAVSRGNAAVARQGAIKAEVAAIKKIKDPVSAGLNKQAIAAKQQEFLLQKQIVAESKKQVTQADRRIKAAHTQNKASRKSLSLAEKELAVSKKLAAGAQTGVGRQQKKVKEAEKATKAAERNSQRALAGSLIATAAGSFLADEGQQRLAKGDSSGKSFSVGGGTLQGAGVGAGIGALFGPFGAAIGGATGAAVGFVTSLKGANKALTNFTKERLSQAGELSASTKDALSVEQIKSLDLGKILEGQKGKLGDATGKTGAGSLFGGTGGFLGGAIFDDSAGDLGNADIELAAFLKKEAAKFTSIELFNKRYAEILADLNADGVSFQPQFDAVVAAAKKAAAATAVMKTGLFKNLDEIEGYLGEVTNRLISNQGNRANLQFLGTGNIGQAKSIAGAVGNVKNIGGRSERDALNSKVKNVVESFNSRNITGNRRAQFGQQQGTAGKIATQFAGANNSIPNIKNFGLELSNAGQIDGDAFNALIQKHFGGVSGKAGETINDAINDIFGDVKESGVDGRKHPAEKTIDGITAKFGPLFESTKKLIAIFDEQTNALRNNLAQQRAIGQQITATQQQRISTGQQGRDILSSQLGTPKTNIGNRQTKALLTGGQSANQLGQQVRGSNANIKSLLAEQAGGNFNEKRGKEIENSLNREIITRDRATIGLKYLGDVATNSAGAVLAFQKAETDRLAKKSILEQKLTGDPAAVRAINEKEGLLGKFKGNTGTANDLTTKTFAELVAFAKEFGDAIVPQTGKSGKETADALLLARSKGKDLGVGSKLNQQEQSKLALLEGRTDGKLFGFQSSGSETKVKNPVTKRQRDKNDQIDRDVAERDALREKGRDAASREVILGTENKNKLKAGVGAASSEASDAAAQLLITLNTQFADLGQIASDAFDRAFTDLGSQTQVAGAAKAKASGVAATKAQMQIDGKIKVDVNVNGLPDLDGRVGTIAVQVANGIVAGAIAAYAKENSLPPPSTTKVVEGGNVNPGRG